MARSRISGAYNIPAAIVRVAETFGLDATATGGNMDYICKVIGENEDGSERIGIISDDEGGGCPERLNDECSVIFMLDESWQEQFGIKCQTVKEAMLILSRAFKTT